MKTTDNHYSISNFNDIIPDEEFETIKNKNIFILVRMNGCIFCDLMKKEWFDTIKKKQKDNDLIFIDIERTMLNYFVNKDKMFNDLNLLTGYPSIFLFNTKKLNQYSGKRTCTDFVKFIDDKKKNITKEKKAKVANKDDKKITSKQKAAVKKDSKSVPKKVLSKSKDKKVNKEKRDKKGKK